MIKDTVKIQGTKDGLAIIVEDGVDIDTVREKIINRIEKSLKFFQGANLIVRVKSLNVNDEELENLKNFIFDKYGVEVQIKKFQERHLKNVTEGEEIFNGLEEGITKFYKGTVRSGQVVRYFGNLVVIGDVNPGGIVQAAGNIVVMGTLRGIAHAGFTGNKDAVIVASSLRAMQLRIASIISRAPDKDEAIDYPEIAVVKKGKIIVKPLYHNIDLW
ncbi:septum site-determining protein MinC [Thermoanaerobacter kivui]|uniref:Probable septum site-determining protein MinC n=1 Tax=Thermoanaerobacter kivui TaxID=2325 RepID=A0A097AQM6_THEKI|nr:septum site-determining protein MinC [Thermoanaerobacter kivui]AIS52092.1 septum site-determining protein MinC [Thermoanaerobacter kivui]